MLVPSLHRKVFASVLLIFIAQFAAFLWFGRKQAAANDVCKIPGFPISLHEIRGINFGICIHKDLPWHCTGRNQSVAVCSPSETLFLFENADIGKASRFVFQRCKDISVVACVIRDDDFKTEAIVCLFLQGISLTPYSLDKCGTVEVAGRNKKRYHLIESNEGSCK